MSIALLTTVIHVDQVSLPQANENEEPAGEDKASER